MFRQLLHQFVVTEGTGLVLFVDNFLQLATAPHNFRQFPTTSYGIPQLLAASGSFLQLPAVYGSFRQLSAALTYGQFPEVLAQKNEEDMHQVLVNYRNTYFTRDLMQLSNIENLDGLLAIFSIFLVLSAHILKCLILPENPE